MTVVRLRSVLCLWLAASSLAAASPKSSYVAPETCALCHKNIAAAQEQSAMAKTWSGRGARVLPANFDSRLTAGSTSAAGYRIQHQDDGLAYSAQIPAAGEVTFPVETVMGGTRHGLGFMVRVGQIERLQLERPALVQARYFWSFKQGAGLALAPGLSPDQPHSYENALGLVLSPSFEKQCLTCHGQPHTLGAGNAGGVRCESCHGPGSEHLVAVGKGQPREGIINPRRQSSDENIEICAQCHAGFGRHIDPTPEELLIANQVQALRASECFIQSGGSFSCTSCHDPHEDAHGDNSATIRTCLSCHSKELSRRAAVCPVNATAGCVGCHMPSVDVGPLRLVDHQIRVHPEQNTAAKVHDPILQSRLKPVREYLRVIENDDRGRISEAKRQIESGNSFYDVARIFSKDPAASIGGFWGDKDIASLEPALARAATKLHYGDISDVTPAGTRCYLVGRMPRDFKWQADRLQREAETLAAGGELTEAIANAQKSLKIYPHFRRALTFIGTTLAQGGNPERGADVLKLANRLYPADAVALFSLGVVLGELNRRDEEIDAYRRVLALEPDFLSAYSRLGVALDSRGDALSSVTTLRQGLNIDPLSAELCRALSISLAHLGENKEAKRYAAMAALLDPQYSVTH